MRSKAWTGKPARQLRAPWTEAWDSPQTPEPMGMPLHWIVTGDAMHRINYYMNEGPWVPTFMDMLASVTFDEASPAP